jgi:hypothetical protein
MLEVCKTPQKTAIFTLWKKTCRWPKSEEEGGRKRGEEEEEEE